MKILLTGGPGYIGGDTAVVLSENSHEVVILDNFFNSRKTVLERSQKILGEAMPCIEGDNSYIGWGANLGTGFGVRVMEMIFNYQKVIDKKVSFNVVGRRQGDIASCYASVDHAKTLLSWIAKKNILDVCSSSWWWESNPNNSNRSVNFKVKI